MRCIGPGRVCEHRGLCDEGGEQKKHISPVNSQEQRMCVDNKDLAADV